MDTLAFGYVIPAIRAYSGLPPVRQCSCRAYKASPTLSGEGPKACAIPSGWSRDGFGMESGTRTSGFLMQEKRLSNRTQIGLKSGVKNEVNFVAL